MKARSASVYVVRTTRGRRRKEKERERKKAVIYALGVGQPGRGQRIATVELGCSNNGSQNANFTHTVVEVCHYLYSACDQNKFFFLKKRKKEKEDRLFWQRDAYQPIPGRSLTSTVQCLPKYYVKLWKLCTWLSWKHPHKPCKGHLKWFFTVLYCRDVRKHHKLWRPSTFSGSQLYCCLLRFFIGL